MGKSSRAHRARRRRRGWWLRLLAVAAVYYGVGRLVWLAVVPGHAAALWPPAGIALAVLLLSEDDGLCLGAALGGFALMLQTFLTTARDIGTAQSVGVAAVVGIGMALEPLIAALLVRRFISPAAAQTEAREALKFALLAGPGPALLGAFVA